MRRLFLYVTAVLLVVSILGAYMAFSLTTEVEEQVPLVNYMETGKFDYVTYIEPSSLFGPEPQEPSASPENPRYPTELIDRLAMTFTYVPASDTSHTVNVKAVLENPGIWQKEITLAQYASGEGTLTVDFPLEVSELNQPYDTIQTETKIYSYQHNVTIVATVEGGGETFVQSLPVKLDKRLVEVDRNLVQTQSGSTGSFSYLVYLKENSVYSESVLKSPPAITPAPPPSYKALKPGAVIFSKLADHMDVTFRYNFQADKPVHKQSE